MIKILLIISYIFNDLMQD